jgi:tRNA A37 threonylcarbamoyladenosine synthetase subunit TsaC/SUA5/YrdC
MLSILGVISALAPVLGPMVTAGLNLAGLSKSDQGVGAFLNEVLDLVAPAAEAGIEVSNIVTAVQAVMAQPGAVTTEEFDALEAKIAPVQGSFRS